MLFDQRAKALPFTSSQVGDRRWLKTRQDSSLLVGVSWRVSGVYSDEGQTLGAEKKDGGTSAMYHPAKLHSSISTVRMGMGLQYLRQCPGLTPTNERSKIACREQRHIESPRPRSIQLDISP